MKHITSLFIVCYFLFSTFLNAQFWKTYPYTPPKSLISFPRDEGRHPGEPQEWWYTTMHLRGKTTGQEYTVMLTYFIQNYGTLPGFRILNFSNETTHRFFDDTKPVVYLKLDTSALNIEAQVFTTHQEYWRTSLDSTGKLIPFEYDIHALTKRGTLDVHLTMTKPPLILADSGFFYQGKENYTYYYSQTGVKISGSFSFLGTSEEIEGMGWIDRQYGDFNPYIGEKYEWFSIRLSNGMDFNLWNIFTPRNKVPASPKYKLLSAYINEHESTTTSDFTLERTKFQKLPRMGNIYASEWHLTCNQLNIDLTLSTPNKISEVRNPFFFYEGTLDARGIIDGKAVNGIGFAELLQQYVNPQIVLLNPDTVWNTFEPIKWSITNPNDGVNLYYDLYYKESKASQFQLIQRTQTDTFYNFDPDLIKEKDSLWFKLFAYSKDTFLRDTVYSKNAIPLYNSNENLYIKTIQLTPNPANNRLTIYLPRENDSAKVSIRNIQGKCIYKEETKNKSKITVDISSFQKGVYIIEYWHSGYSTTKSFIKI